MELKLERKVTDGKESSWKVSFCLFFQKKYGKPWMAEIDDGQRLYWSKNVQ